MRMNARIRELAQQAGEYVNTVYTPPVRSKTPNKIWEDGHVGWHEQFNEKFAELIVRETINEMIGQLWNYGIDESNNPSFYKAVERTKEHFGVEE